MNSSLRNFWSLEIAKKSPGERASENLAGYRHIKTGCHLSGNRWGGGGVWGWKKKCVPIRQVPFLSLNWTGENITWQFYKFQLWEGCNSKTEAFFTVFSLLFTSAADGGCGGNVSVAPFTPMYTCIVRLAGGLKKDKILILCQQDMWHASFACSNFSPHRKPNIIKAIFCKSLTFLTIKAFFSMEYMNTIIMKILCT